jgi:hypothetical protein
VAGKGEEKWGNRLENERKWSAGSREKWKGRGLDSGRKNSTGGAAAAAKDGEESDGFRFRFFFVFFTDVVKIAPPFVWLKMKAIYRQSSFFGLPNWSLKFCVWLLISINSLGKN